MINKKIMFNVFMYTHIYKYLLNTFVFLTLGKKTKLIKNKL